MNISLEVSQREVVNRSVRRTYRAKDGNGEFGWVKLAGRDRKVHRPKRRRTWVLV